MNTSNSGIISTEFVNVSDSFSDYKDISQVNHNRLVKAKRFGKWYVLKGLKEEYSDSVIFVELLRKEFDLGIQLDHPNIIRTIGKESDSYIGDCIVLEYIDGITLNEWLKTTPSKRERCRVVTELLNAMSYFHSKGIIHRDLKPDNILITRNGANVKVIDFGLSDSDEYAILKQPAGNRKYSAPEQLNNCKAIDLRADIYALGAILQEFALSGIYNRIAKRATKENPEERYDNSGQIISAIRNHKIVYKIQVVILIVAVATFGLYSLFTNLQVQPSTTAPVEKIVREVVYRDTVHVIKEVPTVVEKIVLKNEDKADSAYIAQKNWEKQKKDYATKEIYRICAPMKAAAMKAKTQNEYYLDNYIISKTVEQYSKLREELIKDIPKESNFYMDFENRIAVIYGNQLMEIDAILEKLPKE